MRGNHNFPSQVVSDNEKSSHDYGLKVAQAIEAEWFDGERNGNNRYYSHLNNFHKLRLYARGEQSIQKYKDELSINGDLSYLNLDWKPVPIIPKFVDIVVNGISERQYSIKAYSQDPYGVEKRTEYMESILRDMRAQEFDQMASNLLNVDLKENKEEDVPETQEELDLHMSLNYKQAVEIAEEQAINVLLEGNKYDLTRKRLIYDLTVCGMAACKTSFNTAEGVTVEYVDPASMVYSYTDSPYFDDIYYVGEVKSIPINELIKQFPDITEGELEDISKNNYKHNYKFGRRDKQEEDKNKVDILYFNYKTYTHEVYKVKEMSTGLQKLIEKDDSFNPPTGEELAFERLGRKIECLYDGALILGTEKLIKWEKAKNMMRPKSDFNKVNMNYSIVAPRMYEGRIESLVGRITGFADMIQLTHLKLQQVMSRMIPDGIYLDADGLAEIDLGNGTNYNPQEALNMFFQTGSIIGRSMTMDGGQNGGKIPIQEIQSGGGAKMQSLIGTYNYYLQMIRDTTGLNEATDASTPDPKALVGVQKLAAANSNTATRHILQGGAFLTQSICEHLCLRISDILEYSPTANAFVQAIGSHNVATLQEMKNLHLYDFGIFLELAPDEEEKQLLENNIQTALSQQTIDLEDVIDLREIKNIKLANQLLKIRRKKKMERDQKMQQENMQAQAEANAQQTQAAAQAEIQKAQAALQNEIQLETQKGEIKKGTLHAEAEVKKMLMDHEFELNMRMKQMELEMIKEKDMTKEVMKDKKETRNLDTKNRHESRMEDKKAMNAIKTKGFESSGNDVIGGGMRLGAFEPQ
tara:strand:+ start:1103 stop:3526 length:2424 start_codon:yes stop_codon:yes gene_type:complete